MVDGLFLIIAAGASLTVLPLNIVTQMVNLLLSI